MGECHWSGDTTISVRVGQWLGAYINKEYEMSKKHFEDYFLTICSQYHELLENLKELESLCESKVISEEHLENYKNTLQPIRDAYMTVSYIKYLLDIPNRNEKVKRYQNQNIRHVSVLDRTKSPKYTIDRNKKILEELDEMIKDERVS